MKYFIKIILSSIEKNKDAGATTTFVQGPIKVLFKTTLLPEYFIDGENCIITEYEVENAVKTNYSGLITSNELMKRMAKEKPDDMIIEVSNDVQRIDHQPIPKYSYEYENIKVRCASCGKKMYSDELESDCYDDGYSDTICPKCGAWDCCELEYEKIDDVIIKSNQQS